MIQSCVWKLSSGQALGRLHRPILAQPAFFLSWRHEFSSSSPKKPTQKPASEVKTSTSTNNTAKFILGSVAVGAAVITAYQTGYLKFHVKDENSVNRTNALDTVKGTADSKLTNGGETFHPAGQKILPNSEITSQVKPDAGYVNTQETIIVDDFRINTDISETIPIEKSALFKEKEISVSVENAATPAVVQASSSEELSEEFLSKGSGPTNIYFNQEESRKTDGLVEQKQDLVDELLDHSKEVDAMVSDVHQDTVALVQEVSQDGERGKKESQTESYSLLVDGASSKDFSKEGDVDAIATSFKDNELKTFTTISDDDKKSDDAKLVIDFVEAIHAAERKQAESDAYIFSEEKRKLKEKFEKELKDARVREFMYAEEAAILEKEMNKEKEKAAAAIKSIQEQAEQKLKEELQRKVEEADVQLMKAQDLAKAELAATIAREKSSQIEKIAEANLHINALCMAFYARSEEARQTHSVHKLALGTLALEDALSKGLPIRAEVDALYKALDGIDRESLLGLALSSLPDDTLNQGIDTPLQLNQKFHSLKGTLRHFSLIPAGGGGLLAHAVAHIASSIKMREEDGNSGSIESLISRVERFLSEKQYKEAADALEEGVRGTEAEDAAIEWSRLARSRAVAEQALSLLQSYALSITFE